LFAELENAVQCDSKYARAWYNLGLARNEHGDIQEALNASSRAEAIEPNNPQIS
jgi:cytochrome c-type biogenesis protein CcmH/NrfG